MRSSRSSQSLMMFAGLLFSVTHLTMHVLEFDEEIIHNNMMNDVPNFRISVRSMTALNGLLAFVGKQSEDRCILPSSAVPSQALHSIFTETFQGMVS